MNDAGMKGQEQAMANEGQVPFKYWPTAGNESVG